MLTDATPPAPERAGRPTRVVLVPGLGLPAYLQPAVAELRRRGYAVELLDLPGFGRGHPLACPPDVLAVGAAVAAHLRRTDDRGDVVLVGHSTGAASAAAAALAAQETTASLRAVVLAGSLVPGCRTLPRLLALVPAAYRYDLVTSLRAVPDVLRGRADVVRLIRSAVRERPEERIAALRLPLVLTAGRADTYAPRWWLEALAGRAGRAPSTRVRQVPGSHNYMIAAPERLADEVDAAVAAVAAITSRPTSRPTG